MHALITIRKQVVERVQVSTEEVLKSTYDDVDWQSYSNHQGAHDPYDDEKSYVLMEVT